MFRRKTAQYLVQYSKVCQLDAGILILSQPISSPYGALMYLGVNSNYVFHDRSFDEFGRFVGLSVLQYAKGSQPTFPLSQGRSI
jgi:hypothetical protein